MLVRRLLIIILVLTSAYHASQDEATAVAPLLNGGGPDLSIDPDKLASSIVVEMMATASQSDVDEGCAGGTTNRTLVRFDTLAQNFGPDDIEFGAVSCVSTSDAPSCAGLACDENPSCCCDGQSSCSAEHGQGSLFEFNCSHGHVHFTGFSEYRLLDANGAVAATGHKQSFCLLDSEAIGGGSCQAEELFTCEQQGIHAGCADLYESGLVCQYIDATDVPPGEYTVEITMDPLDLIAESNETNNIQTAPVTIFDFDSTLACSGKRCITTPSALDNNIDDKTTWDPCEGGPFTYTGSIDFEPDWDFLTIDGTLYDGRNTAIAGAAPGAASIVIHTDESIASGGISTLDATCPSVCRADTEVVANGLPRSIPDDDPAGITSPLRVEHQSILSTVYVSVNITHPYRGDLEVILISPNGREAQIQSPSGDSAANLILTNVEVPDFEGQPTGATTWQLRIVDHFGSDVGTLDRWSLRTVTTGCPDQHGGVWCSAWLSQPCQAGGGFYGFLSDYYAGGNRDVCANRPRDFIDYCQTPGLQANAYYAGELVGAGISGNAAYTLCTTGPCKYGFFESDNAYNNPYCQSATNPQGFAKTCTAHGWAPELTACSYYPPAGYQFVGEKANSACAASDGGGYLMGRDW